MAQHPPAWIEALVDVVVGCMEAHSPMGSVRWRYREEEALGERVVYPTPWSSSVGQQTALWWSPDFRWICTLLAAFEHVTALQWCPHGFGPYDPDGPCISLEGLYRGHQVWLRMLAERPEDAEPGLHLETSAGR